LGATEQKGALQPEGRLVREQTRALVKAGQSLNLTVHDHLIVGRHRYSGTAKQDMV
jgi:DNA repair protein RadC